MESEQNNPVRVNTTVRFIKTWRKSKKNGNAPVRNAIPREKQIKGGSRAKKIELINGMNAGWKGLYDGFMRLLRKKPSQ